MSDRKRIHVDIRQLYNRPPPVWMIDGVLAERQRAIIYGKPGVGKSFLAADLAHALAFGRPWLGNATARPYNVLLVDNESSDDVLMRMKALEQAHGTFETDRKLGMIEDHVGFTEDGTVENFGAMLKKMGVEVLIIDLMSNVVLQFGNDNAASDTTKAFEVIKRLQRDAPGLTVIGVMHSNASGGLRGSLAIPGAVDLTLSLSEVDEDTVKVEVTKARRIRRGTCWFFELKGEGEAPIVTPTDPGDVPRKSKGSGGFAKWVLHQIANAPGISNTGLAGLELERNPHKSKPGVRGTVSKTTRELEQSGAIVSKGGGYHLAELDFSDVS